MLDRNAYIAIALSMVIWLGWNKFYFEPIQQKAAQEQKLKQEEAAKAAEVEAAKVAPAKAPSLDASMKTIPTGSAEAKKVSLENDTSTLTLSNEAWSIQGWQLKTFSRSLDKVEDKVTMDEVTGFPTQLRARFSDPALSANIEHNWSSLEKVGNRKAESKLNTADVQATRTFTLNDDGYGARVDYTFKFAKEPPNFVYLDLVGSPKRASDKEGSIFGQAPDKVKITFRDLNGRHSDIGASLKENKESSARVKWLGLDTRYFVFALVPVVDAETDMGAQVAHDTLNGGPAVRGNLVFPTKGKKEITISAKVYFGPKEMANLNSVDSILADTIDFGWTSFIAIPLLQALKWLYSFVKNYGVAIIVLTFLIKMLLFPLMYKSMASMAKMSKLQPQLNALREKYKDDKEKLNVEMMNFMKQNGYNPIGGCLPILFQMPIFFALYRVLFNSMELYQAPFGLWIHDLSSPDPFYVTPVLLTGLMYLQQKLSPNTAADPAQQKMLQIMPVMFGAFMLMLPSGLTIYMVVNSAVSIGQQYFLNHKLGITKQKAVAAKA